MPNNQRRESKVFEGDMLQKIVEIESTRLASLRFSAHELSPGAAVLKYSSAGAFRYATEHCAGGNDCADNAFDNDCTHFMCHCLFGGGVLVPDPTYKCKSGLCVRVNDLAATFANSVGTYSNVKRIGSHDATKRGDFCFVPGWFGLKKSHVMLLAATATAKGAMVYAHTNERCGTLVDFEGESCAYYRIEDA